MKVLSGEQAQKFLDAAKDDPFEALYVLALTTGMRQGELLALKWDDINFSQGTLQVRRTITRLANKGFTVSEPKTAKSRRSVHLAPMAVDALKRHRIRQNELRLLTGPTWDEQGWVFCNAVGRPIEVGNMTRRSFRPLLAKAGFLSSVFMTYGIVLLHCYLPQVYTLKLCRNSSAIAKSV